MPLDPFRLLLDQNFPKPPGFDLRDVDESIEAVHVHDFDASLTEAETPDWYLYLRAAEAGFDAFVTRDASQTALDAEMWVLTRIRILLVTFRSRLEDPVAEWGQILAFLPLLRDRAAQGGGSRVLLLPRPQLSESRSETQPTDRFARLADDLGLSQRQARRDVRQRVLTFLADRGEEQRFNRLLKL